MATEYDIQEEKVSTPNFDKWKKGIKSKNPDVDENDTEALYAASMKGYDDEHDYAKNERGYVTQMKMAIDKYPEVGEFVQNLLDEDEKGLGRAILSLKGIYQQLLDGEITDEEFNKARKELEAQKEEEEAKLAKQNEAFEKVCSERGVDPDEMRNRLNDVLFSKLVERSLSEKEWGMLIDMLDYDNNIKQAEIKGRNANIEAKRGEVHSDGLPKSNSAPFKVAQENTYKDNPNFNMGARALRYYQNQKFK